MLTRRQNVTIKDIGSLHGTFVNDKRLGKFERQEVQHGDWIRFGVPIQKGSTVFAPRVMELSLKFE